MVDGFEPHDHITPGILTARVDDDGRVGGEGCTRGGEVGWGREGYTGTPARTIPGPIFSIFKAKGSTHGQMKANSQVFMRFLR